VLRNAAEIRDRYMDEIRILQPNGAVRWMLLQAKVFYSSSGAPSRLSGICMDITERKELAEKLRLNMEQLQQANQKKSEFIAILSHELRNPLAPIINAVQVLRAKDVSEMERDWSREIIDRQVQQMIRIMDDLLDVGRITHEKLSLRREQILLTSVIDSAIETSKPLIEERRQQLTIDLPAGRIVLNADYRRLSQVFSNLLNNAAKYTAYGGRILLAAKRQDNDAVVSIKDNGIGISAELLPDIFDIFVQAKSSHESERGGLGLGLTLVRSFVALHGGNVEARSDGLGHGSEFLVRLPIAEIDPLIENQESKLQTIGPSTAEKTRHILVVDDLMPQAKSLAMLLQLRGHDVRIAHDGPHALEILQEFSADVALIDIGLPGMDGYSLARRIREQPQFRTTVLVAQTGWAHEDDRLRSQEAGFDYHLAKPIDHDRLHEILSEPPRSEI
jgi:signal transduction histidine kinase/ActR/RegA family two-component response regulator